jgi:hypothetical protein
MEEPEGACALSPEKRPTSVTSTAMAMPRVPRVLPLRAVSCDERPRSERMKRKLAPT